MEDKELDEVLQKFSNYLDCPIACAKNLRYNGFYFHAFIRGRPANLVEFSSGGLVSNLEEDGYNACIEIGPDNKEHYHRVDICDEVFILPIKSNEFVDKIYMPENKEIIEDTEE